MKDNDQKKITSEAAMLIWNFKDDLNEWNSSEEKIDVSNLDNRHSDPKHLREILGSGLKMLKEVSQAIDDRDGKVIRFKLCFKVCISKERQKDKKKKRLG